MIYVSLRSRNYSVVKATHSQFNSLSIQQAKPLYEITFHIYMREG